MRDLRRHFVVCRRRHTRLTRSIVLVHGIPTLSYFTYTRILGVQESVLPVVRARVVSNMQGLDVALYETAVLEKRAFMAEFDSRFPQTESTDTADDVSLLEPSAAI